ncbi:hypothetical protein ACQP3L_34980, partial [Escherichia coli]
NGNLHKAARAEIEDEYQLSITDTIKLTGHWAKAFITQTFGTMVPTDLFGLFFIVFFCQFYLHI